MPSGFQQDSNQLSPDFYRVVIDMTSGTYYPTADATTNGAVTPSSADSFSTANFPTTYAKGKARARGNMRFRNVINRLTGLADCQIIDIEIGAETNGDAQATSLAFTARFDRDNGIPLTGTLQGTATVGNDIAGNAMDTVAKAIKDAVTRGIMDATTASARVYNPAGYSNDSQESITVASPNATIANIYGTVTVALIDGTELITADNAGTAE
jgi:hypothetical protein